VGRLSATFALHHRKQAEHHAKSRETLAGLQRDLAAELASLQPSAFKDPLQQGPGIGDAGGLATEAEEGDGIGRKTDPRKHLVKGAGVHLAALEGQGLSENKTEGRRGVIVGGRRQLDRIRSGTTK
jgi:hypothetical protein